MVSPDGAEKFVLGVAAVRGGDGQQAVPYGAGCGPGDGGVWTRFRGFAVERDGRLEIGTRPENVPVKIIGVGDGRRFREFLVKLVQSLERGGGIALAVRLKGQFVEGPRLDAGITAVFGEASEGGFGLGADSGVRIVRGQLEHGVDREKGVGETFGQKPCFAFGGDFVVLAVIRMDQPVGGLRGEGIVRKIVNHPAEAS